MTSAIEVRVTKDDLDFNERERKFAEILILHLCAHTNSRVTGQGMAMNPIEPDNIQNTIFSIDLCFQDPISEDKSEEFVNGLTRGINGAMKMCNVENVVVDLRTR